MAQIRLEHHHWECINPGYIEGRAAARPYHLGAGATAATARRGMGPTEGERRQAERLPYNTEAFLQGADSNGGQRQRSPATGRDPACWRDFDSAALRSG
jgi:hypothetical protein